ncbi:MAG: DUF4139 domain-containing protein [Vampirovibrio sp.]|nr:DUF4139 domain-containing protein [Vampirovibrio sp.]
MKPAAITQSSLVSALITGVFLVLPLASFAKNPEITVYNQNFALVKDYRTLDLKKGSNVLFMDDVAALIDPTSVHFKSLTAPDSVIVQEQNFRYDLINKTNILDRMVGKKIRFKKDGDVHEGTLLNPVTNFIRRPQLGRYASRSHSTQNTSNFAVQTKDGVLLTTLNEILIDKLPPGLYPRPTLMWHLDSGKGGSHQTELSYLTDGMTWNTDYVVTVNKDDSQIDLTGWVTLDNQSGAAFENATLKLIAGDVRKIQNVGGMADMAMPMAAMESRMGQKKQFQEESFFEYHLYTLQHPTTLANRETKQVTLVSANEAPITKKYIYDPDRSQYMLWLSGRNSYYGTFNYYANRPGQGRDTRKNKKVNTMLILENSKKNNLGMPLPKGRVRVQKADNSGAIQFVGEDLIDHTPEDEKIELYVGDAFDLVGEKKRTRYVKQKDYIEESYQVDLRNHKKSAATIHVTEHLFGDWQMVMNSHKFNKADAHTIHFPVTVPAKGKAMITYTIRIKRG